MPRPEYEELPNELQVEAFAYGENEKCIEIKLHPRVPDNLLGNPNTIAGWAVDFARKLLKDVKHIEKWKCEFCGKHAQAIKAQAGFWTHLTPPRMVLYIHEICDSGPCAVQPDLLNLTMNLPPGTLNTIDFERNTVLPVSGSCINCGRDQGMLPDGKLRELSRCGTCKLTRDCQKADWPRHKHEHVVCKAIRSVN
ncbi:hypothetical protein L218DRAFT_550929 [Marasmius fiardii PR-910]|nr:hypothetical protein L218DRAFT_550929 [Marasmius fiardii PR-910]